MSSTLYSFGGLLETVGHGVGITASFLGPLSKDRKTRNVSHPLLFVRSCEGQSFHRRPTTVSEFSGPPDVWVALLILKRKNRRGGCVATTTVKRTEGTRWVLGGALGSSRACSRAKWRTGRDSGGMGPREICPCSEESRPA